MDNEEIFDQVADDYDQILTENLSLYGKDISYYAEYKIKLIDRVYTEKPLNILEFGCGTGRNIEYIKKYFPDSNITGADISLESLSCAREQKKNNGVSFVHVDELEACTYDLIFVAGVFHHIPPEERSDALKSLSSFLTQDGSIFIFELNPYNPITRRTVSTCPFDEGVILLKPKDFRTLVKQTELTIVKNRYCMFFPSMFKFFAFIDCYISYVPLGGQYVVELRKT